jgi:predicted AlkP superfamily phosphohydrolase/phosphomutase
MGDILTFPSQQAQGLAFLDRELRSLLQTKGADEQLIDFAAGQLTRIYAQLSESEQYSFCIDLPATISDEERDKLHTQVTDGLEGIRQENHALMVQLIAQLVLAEVRVFQHERSE